MKPPRKHRKPRKVHTTIWNNYWQLLTAVDRERNPLAVTFAPARAYPVLPHLFGR